MFRRLIATTLLFVLFVGYVPAKPTLKKRFQRISRQALEDKIRGGWAGQMIGVSYGAPTEFESLGKIIETNIDNYQNWTPERVSNAIKQDDLYVEMTFAEVMDRLGLNATIEDYGEAFKNSKYPLWHANASARRLLNRGIKPPWSGHPRYNIHANDIDFQIESDFIGMMTPGLPQEANRFAERVGRLMNYGDGLYGGMFFSGMYAATFFENDSRTVVEKGLASIPERSGYARIIRDVLDWSSQYPEDWKKTWHLIEDKWNRDDTCIDGALRPFNIDARLNGAYVVLGLLYGKGDFAKTLEISTRSGQDSDCNPSSAVGILGVILGYSGIPDEWKSGIEKISERKFDYTNYSFRDITKSTVERALKVIINTGGKITDDEVFVPYQMPKTPKLEQWDMGIPHKLIEVKEVQWLWKGAWSEETDPDTNTLSGMVANGAGSEATLKFNGVAVALVGPLSQSGGKGYVYLDGKMAGEIDAYIALRTYDRDLWHVSGLKPGQHTIRIVTSDDAHKFSKGRKILIMGAIEYQRAGMSRTVTSKRKLSSAR